MSPEDDQNSVLSTFIFQNSSHARPCLFDPVPVSQDQSLHTYKTKHTYTNIKLLELVPSLLPLLKKNVGLGHAAVEDGKCVCIVAHGHTHTFSLSHGFTEQSWQNECINYIPSSLFPQGTQNPDSERCGTACAFTQKSCISDAKVWVD